MSGSSDAPGRREVAHRLFATEYDDASLEYSEGDEERAPNYVVTPTGARVNRLFVVGVLTAVEPVNEETVRARVVDPTGAFVVYAGQYQPDELAFFERAEPPTFVALTGKANAFSPDDSDRVLTSVRPETVNEVDADARDRWVVSTAEATLSRIGVIADALDRTERSDDLVVALEAAGYDHATARGVALALDHYETTADYLGALRDVATDAVRVVANRRDEVRDLSLSPGQQTGEFDAAVLAAEAPRTPVVDAVEDGSDDTQPEVSEVSDAETAGAATSVAEPAGSDEPEPATTETEPTAAEQTSGEVETPEPEGADSPSGLGNFESEDGGDTGTSPPETDEMYEFDEEERQQVKEEHGLEFSTGTEVEQEGGTVDSTDQPVSDRPDEEAATEPDEPDEEAATEPDEPDEEAATEPDEGVEEEDVESDERTDDAETEEMEDDIDDGDAPDEEASIDEVLLDQMKALDDGDGADRTAVLEAVMDATGASEDAVEEAIDDALMSGQCYEPDEDSLKPI